MASSSINLGPADVIPEGARRVLLLLFGPVVVFHNGDAGHAFKNACPHKNGPFHRGTLRDGSPVLYPGSNGGT